MTSPESRPRVEGERVARIAANEELYVGAPREILGDLAHDLLLARAQVAALTGVAERSTQTVDEMFEKNQRLTAEVERLTKERDLFAEAVARLPHHGREHFAARFAALSLPTPAPLEGTNDE